jgi:hypothetical protein
MLPCAPAVAHRDGSTWLPNGFESALDSHYTPKHGSWLNIAEIELPSSVGSASSGACRTARFSKPKSLPGRTAATSRAGPWTGASATEHARIKLKRSYPSLHEQ